MSVLSRLQTIPTQRAAKRVLDLDERPTAQAAAPAAPTTDSNRVALLVAGAVVLVTAGIGATATLLNDDGAPAVAPTSTSVDASLLTSEAKRDAAAASRYLTR